MAASSGRSVLLDAYALLPLLLVLGTAAEINQGQVLGSPAPASSPMSSIELRERVRGEVRGGVAAEGVREGVRVVLRALPLRAAGHRGGPRPLPLLRRRHHPRRPPQVPLS
ncbi:hypothetical protein ACP4OV_025831 [Aristida adscensionis]